MQFLIADTFTESLSRLTAAEQTAAKTTAFDLQVNPANPGLQFHRIDRSKDPNFWSVRVSGDLRVIVHKTARSLLLCYAGHHDDAYRWAERRKLETHPATHAAQLVEVRERVQEITIPKYVEAEQRAAEKPPLFSNISDDRLFECGVPLEWMEDVKRANEDTLLSIADHLPAEAAEALLEIATGAPPPPIAARKPPVMAQAIRMPETSREGTEDSDIKARLADHEAAVMSQAMVHPDAGRRFRIIDSPEDLRMALDAPWEKWTVFLHPEQRKVVEREYNGPARVSGSAGTGKTIVALHRAVHLARKYPQSRMLLATFSETLANALRQKLRLLIVREPMMGERIEVHSMDALGRYLYELNIGKLKLANSDKVRQLLQDTTKNSTESKFSLRFLETEWEQVVDAWRLQTWESYRNVARLGRRTRLKEAQRQTLWGIFTSVRSDLERQGLITQSELFNRLAEHFAHSTRPFNFVVVDEAQDVSIAQLRFLASIGAGEPNGLFFAGDLGQRIFQQPFSWRALGVDIRGRSTTLRINYRTSHQIRTQADRLLAPEVADVDGNVEHRKGTISLFNGPQPEIAILESEEKERDKAQNWLRARRAEGVLPHEMAIFVRSKEQMSRAETVAKGAGLAFKVLDQNVELSTGKMSLATMHMAKGLEFRAVVVLACDDEVIPLQSRIEGVTDDSDLEDVYNTERQLLYVACTRARDSLLVTGVKPGSEFLDDLSKAAQ